jgi:hypothetical protein
MSHGHAFEDAEPDIQLSDECGEGSNLEAEMKVRAKAQVRKMASVMVHVGQ